MKLIKNLFVLTTFGQSSIAMAQEILREYLQLSGYNFQISGSKNQKSKMVDIKGSGWSATITLRYSRLGLTAVQVAANASASPYDPTRKMQIDTDFAGWANDSGLASARGEYGVLLVRSARRNGPLTAEIRERTDAIFRIAVQDWLMSREGGKHSTPMVSLEDAVRSARAKVTLSGYGSRAIVTTGAGKRITFIVGYSSASAGGNWYPLSVAPKLVQGRIHVRKGDVEKLLKILSSSS